MNWQRAEHQSLFPLDQVSCELEVFFDKKRKTKRDGMESQAFEISAVQRVHLSQVHHIYRRVGKDGISFCRNLMLKRWIFQDLEEQIRQKPVHVNQGAD